VLRDALTELAALSDALTEKSPFARPCPPHLLGTAIARELALVGGPALAQVLEDAVAPTPLLTQLTQLSSAPGYVDLLRAHLGAILAALAAFAESHAVAKDLVHVLESLGDDIPLTAVQLAARSLAAAPDVGLAAAQTLPAQFRDFLRPYVAHAFSCMLESNPTSLPAC
jgi:hypothetical protein